jgi:hypothetical protein
LKENIKSLNIDFTNLTNTDSKVDSGKEAAMPKEPIHLRK